MASIKEEKAQSIGKKIKCKAKKKRGGGGGKDCIRTQERGSAVGENKNSKTEMARHQSGKSDTQILSLSPHRWVNSDSELPSSSISSSPAKGCLFFTAVEVRVGVGGMLFSCRLSSWEEEMSSLCCLEEPEKSRCPYINCKPGTATNVLTFEDLPRIWLEKVKKGMENLYGLIML